jgi:SAM-dependent methyltransferase
VDWEAFRRDTDLGSYEHRWEQLEAAGVDPHGEVALVQRYAPRTALDAGCGTGRVAIELARRGLAVGVDRDADMVEIARAKAPELGWVVLDLAELAIPDRFDVVVLAGNVVPYIAEMSP